MGVSLTKGGNVSLTKEAPGLSAVVVGLGWDARTTDGGSSTWIRAAIACNAGGTVYSRSTSSSSTTCRPRTARSSTPGTT